MFEALIQKLEAAVEWDEQLDREIEEAIDGDGRRLGWGPYPYTSKIDAARGLLDRVLPGWSYRVARCAVSDDAWVMPDFNCPVHGERLRGELRQDIDWTDLTDVDLRPSGREATALCISILKALEIINAKSHQAPEAAPAEAGSEARPNGEASAPAEIGADGERAQQKDETLVVDLTPIFDDHPFVARSTMLAALDAERGNVAREARRYASFYPEASDGRNTFIMFAEYVESRLEVPLEVFTIGDNTMSRVFKPSGLTNLHDLQAVLNAVEKVLSDDEPVAAMTTDYLGCEYVSMDVSGIEKIAASGSEGSTEVIYLYDKPQQDVERGQLFGPYAHLNGNRHLAEDEWTVEDNPIENTEEYFSIPLYASVEPPFPSGSEKQDQNVKPLDLTITKEWFEKRAALEGDHEIGAGARKITASIDPTPEELAELHRLAHRIPEGWQLVPKEPTRMMDYAGHDKFVDIGSSRYQGLDPHREIWSAMLAAAPAGQDGT
ncbi:hypothetical protein LJR221_001498 [Agrobacterium tumefaciens]